MHTTTKYREHQGVGAAAEGGEEGVGQGHPRVVVQGELLVQTIWSGGVSLKGGHPLGHCKNIHSAVGSYKPLPKGSYSWDGECIHTVVLVTTRGVQGAELLQNCGAVGLKGPGLPLSQRFLHPPPLYDREVTAQR